MTSKTNQNITELEAFFARQELMTAPAWRPEPGETVIGEVVGLRMGADAGYGAYPVIVVRTETGTVSIHAFHTLLRDGLREIGVKLGMRLAVTYKGVLEKNKQTDPENPDSYHMYFVADLEKLAAGTPAIEEGFTI